MFYIVLYNVSALKRLHCIITIVFIQSRMFQYENFPLSIYSQLGRCYKLLLCINRTMQASLLFANFLLNSGRQLILQPFSLFVHKISSMVILVLIGLISFHIKIVQVFFCSVPSIPMPTFFPLKMQLCSGQVEIGSQYRFDLHFPGARVLNIYFLCFIKSTFQTSFEKYFFPVNLLAC